VQNPVSQFEHVIGHWMLAVFAQIFGFFHWQKMLKVGKITLEQRPNDLCP